MVDDRKVPEGYKVTEVGVIPEEWVVEQLETCASIIDPHPSHRAPKAVNNGIPFVGIGDISEFGIINYKTTRYVGEYVYFEHCKRYDLSKKLIGIGRVASIGKVVKFKNNIGKYTISPTIAVVESKGIDGELLYYLLKSISVERQFSSISNGSTRQSVGIMTLRKIFLSFPKNEVEQKAIAEALSDTDSLIQSVEKLIDKKKKIKHGAMQQLLTGKKRLPGFSGSTTLVTLDDILSLNKGEQLNRSGLSSKGDYPVINGGVEPSGYTDGWNTLENTITISEGGNSCGYVNYLETKFWSGGHAYTVKLKSNEIDQHYLYQLLKINESKIMALRVGSGLPNIQKKSLYEYKVRLVVDLVEQKAIAQVLSDMDSEIKALEEKLEKYKTIKQGMMQELLTGRIRLI